VNIERSNFDDVRSFVRSFFRSNPFTHSLTHSLTHFTAERTLSWLSEPAHSPTHSLTHPLTSTTNNSLTHYRSSTHHSPPTPTPTHPHPHSLTHRPLALVPHPFHEWSVRFPNSFSPPTYIIIMWYSGDVPSFMCRSEPCTKRMLIYAHMPTRAARPRTDSKTPAKQQHCDSPHPTTETCKGTSVSAHSPQAVSQPTHPPTHALIHSLKPYDSATGTRPCTAGAAHHACLCRIMQYFPS